jgi:hypothetical protein
MKGSSKFIKIPYVHRTKIGTVCEHTHVLYLNIFRNIGFLTKLNKNITDDSVQTKRPRNTVTYIFIYIVFIQYFRSYPPYLKAVCSIRNLRARHTVVTRDPLNVGCDMYKLLPFQSISIHHKLRCT